MTLFIDADACPVTAEALAVARRAGVAVVIAGNTTQNLERHVRSGDPRDAAHARRGFWVDTLAVSTGADSADFAIVESLRPGDVVVTQDIGLAAMVLGRGARAIGVRGRVFVPRRRRCAGQEGAPRAPPPSPTATAGASWRTSRTFWASGRVRGGFDAPPAPQIRSGGASPCAEVPFVRVFSKSLCRSPLRVSLFLPLLAFLAFHRSQKPSWQILDTRPGPEMGSHEGDFCTPESKSLARRGLLCMERLSSSQ